MIQKNEKILSVPFLLISFRFEIYVTSFLVFILFIYLFI